MASKEHGLQLAKNLSERELRTYCEFFHQNGLQELEIERGEVKIKLERESIEKREVEVSAGERQGTVEVEEAKKLGEEQAERAAVDKNYKAILAPITGNFYASENPGEAPFIKIGDQVAVGQVVGLVGAMKTFYPLKSEFKGTVAKILVEDQSAITEKEPLIYLK